MDPHITPLLITPELSADLLRGADKIAEYLFGKASARRKVYHLVETSRLPVFRLGSVLCARRSVLMDWINHQENRIKLAEQKEAEQRAQDALARKAAARQRAVAKSRRKAAEREAAKSDEIAGHSPAEMRGVSGKTAPPLLSAEPLTQAPGKPV